MKKLHVLSPQANYTKRAQLAGEFSVKFCGYRVPCDQHDASLRPYSRLFRQVLNYNATLRKIKRRLNKDKFVLCLIS
jgi:hypothetical protein